MTEPIKGANYSSGIYNIGAYQSAGAGAANEEAAKSADRQQPSYKEVKKETIDQHQAALSNQMQAYISVNKLQKYEAVINKMPKEAKERIEKSIGLFTDTVDAVSTAAQAEGLSKETGDAIGLYFANRQI